MTIFFFWGKLVHEASLVAKVAWRGTLFISQHYICFHSTLFGQKYKVIYFYPPHPVGYLTNQKQEIIPIFHSTTIKPKGENAFSLYQKASKFKVCFFFK